jgi:uncharacterized NAD-dependent epimerase/dehydratase family protein
MQWQKTEAINICRIYFFVQFRTILEGNFNYMDGKAILLTQGMLDTHSAKTAHGLIRGSDRYQVVAVIDHRHAGKDAGEVLDGVTRDIPIYDSVESFAAHGQEADFLIIGVATKGGYIPEVMRMELSTAITKRLNIVNGLHEFLSEDNQLVALAEQHKVQLVDIRKPRTKDQLKFWEGSIKQVKCPIIAVLGTDCAVGKRTTARMLVEAARSHGLISEMIFTGQTGWLQGAKYGFIFDSTYNDFVSGELEQAVVSCYQQESPDIIFLEGQSSLQNPTGPCGAEFLLSGRADGVVLQHVPGRRFFGDDPALGEIPPLQNELDLIRIYGSYTIAITLNTKGLNQSQADEIQKSYQQQFGIPVIQPLKQGVSEIISLIQQDNA